MQKPIGSIVNQAEPAKPNGIPTISIDSPATDGDIGGGEETGERGGKPHVIHGYETIEPGTLGSETKRRRGGRRSHHGTTSVGTSEKAKADPVEALSALLYSVHSLLALRVEEFSIEKSEAAQMAEGIKEVAKFYPHSIDPKMLAWGNLGVIMCGVYGPRYAAYRMRKKQERKEKVVPIASGSAAPPPRPAAANGAPGPAAAPVVPSQIWTEGVVDG